MDEDNSTTISAAAPNPDILEKGKREKVHAKANLDVGDELVLLLRDPFVVHPM